MSGGVKLYMRVYDMYVCGVGGGGCVNVFVWSQSMDRVCDKSSGQV